MPRNRQLSAIMFTDIEGYTAMMQYDENQAIKVRNKHREVIDSVTNKYNGELIQYYGDGTLSTFKSSLEAVQCAIELQTAFREDPKIPVRIGIHVGDIIRTESDIIGDAVNVASRIESLAVVGSVLISDKVNDALRNKTGIQTEFIEAIQFKNVNKVIPVFAITNKGLIIPKKEDLEGKTRSKGEENLKQFKKKASYVLTALVLLIIAISYFAIKNADNNGASNGGLATLAVLPFQDMNNNEESTIFTDGITEDIITHLSKIQNLQVISRASAMYYKNTELSLQEIADELDVNYILEGSVRVNNKQVRINANLVDASNNKNIWAENYDNVLDHIFEIQSAVSFDIAEALEITLTDTEESRIDNAPTENAQAYTAFKEGQMFLHRGGGKIEELERAEQFFKTAIDLDPEFCRAYVGVAETYLEYIFWGRESPKNMLDKALSPALTALNINPNDGGTYGALGAISYYRFEKETAIRYLEKAIEINPSYAGAYNKLAWIHTFDNNLDLMEKNFNKVLKLDPLSPKYIGDMGQAYYYLNEFEKGIEFIDEQLIRFPNNDMLVWMKGNLLSGLGKYEDAIKHFTSRSVARNTNWMLGYSYGMNGDTEKAKEILDYQINKSKLVYVPAYMIATIYMGLGDSENALTWLEKDYENGGQGLFFWGLRNDIKFKSIIDEDRFQALLSKVPN